MNTANDFGKILLEIDRVESALAKTKSSALKRDYEKYLKKLLKKREVMKHG